jgi:hypothetical protein
MIAPKLSPVWPALGSKSLFPDALGIDHAPFAWGSGMGLLPVGARETISLGVMTREEIDAQAELMRTPVIASPGESLELRPRVTDEVLRESLADEMGGLAEWQGDVFVFTDPNGSRPVAIDDLETIWSRPLPPRFRSEEHPTGLFQRDAVLDFGEDPEAFAKRPERDAWDDLARAIGRVSDETERRRILSTIADREETSWIDRVTSSDLWSEALDLTDLVPRAVSLVKAIRNLFL